MLGGGWIGLLLLEDRLERLSWLPDLPSARRPDLNAPPEFDPDCVERLAALPGVEIRPVASFERHEGCLVEGAVYADQLAGLSFRPAAPLMQCRVAEELHHWLEEAVIPAAEEQLGTVPRSVGHIGTYNCRTIGGSSTLSQHSFANAVDVAWFDMADGRRLRLREGWDDPDPAISGFWQRIQRLSCKYFRVSLGPDYNRAHADHFHFDLGPLRTCR